MWRLAFGLTARRPERDLRFTGGDGEGGLTGGDGEGGHCASEVGLSLRRRRGRLDARVEGLAGALLVEPLSKLALRAGRVAIRIGDRSIGLEMLPAQRRITELARDLHSTDEPVDGLTNAAVGALDELAMMDGAKPRAEFRGKSIEERTHSAAVELVLGKDVGTVVREVHKVAATPELR